MNKEVRVSERMNEMCGSPIRVFLLDTSPMMRAIFPEYLQEQEGMELCGSASGADHALRQLEYLRPDVLLLGLDAPYEEWMYFLSAMRQMPSCNETHVIVSCSDLRGQVCREFSRYNVDCFMARPVQLPLLIERIRNVSHQKEPLRQDLETLVTKFVLSLEVGMKLLGCTYIADALLLLLSQGKPYPRMEEIYQILMKRHDTTVSCVESAMRKAIKRIFQQNSLALQEMLHLSHVDGVTHMSNADFLFMLTAGMQIKYEL